MKHTDIQVILKQEKNGEWFGTVREKDSKRKRWVTMKTIFGTEHKHESFGKSIGLKEFVEGEDPLDDDVIRDQYGFVAIKKFEDKKDDTKVNIVLKGRAFNYKGLSFPIAGKLLDVEDMKVAKLTFDSGYYGRVDKDTGVLYWKKAEEAGKLKYCFENNEELPVYGAPIIIDPVPVAEVKPAADVPVIPQAVETENVPF